MVSPNTVHTPTGPPSHNWALRLGWRTMKRACLPTPECCISKTDQCLRLLKLNLLLFSLLVKLCLYRKFPSVRIGHLLPFVERTLCLSNWFILPFQKFPPVSHRPSSLFCREDYTSVSWSYIQVHRQQIQQSCAMKAKTALLCCAVMLQVRSSVSYAMPNLLIC